jgi:hypothetical protein
MRYSGCLHCRQKLRRHDLGFLGDDEAESGSLVHFDSARHKDCSAE